MAEDDSAETSVMSRIRMFEGAVGKAQSSPVRSVSVPKKKQQSPSRRVPVAQRYEYTMKVFSPTKKAVQHFPPSPKAETRRPEPADESRSVDTAPVRDDSEAREPPSPQRAPPSPSRTSSGEQRRSRIVEKYQSTVNKKEPASPRQSSPGSSAAANSRLVSKYIGDMNAKAEAPSPTSRDAPGRRGRGEPVERRVEQASPSSRKSMIYMQENHRFGNSLKNRKLSPRVSTEVTVSGSREPKETSVTSVGRFTKSYQSAFEPKAHSSKSDAAVGVTELKRNLDDASVILEEEKNGSSVASSNSSRSSLSHDQLRDVAKRSMQLSAATKKAKEMSARNMRSSIEETRAMRMQNSPLTQMLNYKRIPKVTSSQNGPMQQRGAAISQTGDDSTVSTLRSETAHGNSYRPNPIAAPSPRTTARMSRAERVAALKRHNRTQGGQDDTASSVVSAQASSIVSGQSSVVGPNKSHPVFGYSGALRRREVVQADDDSSVCSDASAARRAALIKAVKKNRYDRVAALGKSMHSGTHPTAFMKSNEKERTIPPQTYQDRKASVDIRTRTSRASAFSQAVSRNNETPVVDSTTRPSVPSVSLSVETSTAGQNDGEAVHSSFDMLMGQTSPFKKKPQSPFNKKPKQIASPRLQTDFSDCSASTDDEGAQTPISHQRNFIGDVEAIDTGTGDDSADTYDPFVKDDIFRVPDSSSWVNNDKEWPKDESSEAAGSENDVSVPLSDDSRSADREDDSTSSASDNDIVDSAAIQMYSSKAAGDVPSDVENSVLLGEGISSGDASGTVFSISSVSEQKSPKMHVLRELGAVPDVNHKRGSRYQNPTKTEGQVQGSRRNIDSFVESSSGSRKSASSGSQSPGKLRPLGNRRLQSSRKKKELHDDAQEVSTLSGTDATRSTTNREQGSSSSEPKSLTTHTTSSGSRSQKDKTERPETLRWWQRNYGKKVSGITNAVVRKALKRKDKSSPEKPLQQDPVLVETTKSEKATALPKSTAEEDDDIFFGLEDADESLLDRTASSPRRRLNLRTVKDSKMDVEPCNEPESPRISVMGEHSGRVVDRRRELKDVSSELTSSVVAGKRITRRFRQTRVDPIQEEPMATSRPSRRSRRVDSEEEQELEDSVQEDVPDANENEESFFVNIGMAIVDSLTQVCRVPGKLWIAVFALSIDCEDFDDSRSFVHRYERCSELREWIATKRRRCTQAMQNRLHERY